MQTFPGSKDQSPQLAQLNADGQTLVDVVWPIGEGGVVNSWDVATRKPRGSRPLHLRGDPGTLALTRDGRTLAASRGVVIARGPTYIQLVDVLSGNEVRTLTPGHGPLGVTALAFREDGRILASGGADGSVILWNVASGSKQATMGRQATPVYALALSPDGTRVASGSADGTIKFWDATTGNELATGRGHTNMVASLAFSPDGKTLASASWDNTIILWEPTTGQQRATLTGHDGYVFSVAFSPDGKTLASGSRDRTIKLWEAVFPQEGNQPADKARQGQPQLLGLTLEAHRLRQRANCPTCSPGAVA